MAGSRFRFWKSLFAFLQKRRLENDLDAEVSFHLEMQIRQNIESGMHPEEARYAARRLFGGLDQLKEQCRDERRGNFFESLISDIRQGLRQLRRNPGFTITAAATLALGIGVNTAIFSIVNAALVRPLPFADQDRLVFVWETRSDKSSGNVPSAPGNFLDWRAQSRSLAALAATADTEFNLTGEQEPERVTGGAVSANYFDLLGMKPALGRAFRPDEDLPSAAPVVILTHGFWQRRFGGDPAIIGKKITLDAKPHTVIGVLPGESYSGLEQFYVPFVMQPGAREDRYGHWLGVIARVQSGYSIEQAEGEMNLIARRLAKDHPQTNTGWGIHLVRFRDEVAGFLRPALLLLLGAVGFVLLIACANVSNLLLARAAPRQREMAIRLALGAGRWRLMRQLLTESLLLSLFGAALGLLAARWGLNILLTAAPRAVVAQFPYLKTIPIDTVVLSFTIILCGLAAILCGFTPALHVSRRDPQQTLQAASRGSTMSRFGQRVRAALVTAELGLAMILLVGAGLALRSLLHVVEVNPGFNPDHLLTMRISLSPANYKERRHMIHFHEELIRGLRSIPGVVNASTATVAPLSGRGHPSTFGIVDRQTPSWRAPTAQALSIGPAYFATMGAPLLAGRALSGEDTEKAPKVALVNATLARSFFPNEDPIGKKIVIWRESPEPREIVGVVGDLRDYALDRPAWPHIYLPFAHNPQLEMSVVMRASSDPLRLIADAHRVIASIDRDVPVFDVMTMHELIGNSPTLALRRVPSLLMAVLAGAALLLAAVGIAGVMSSMVGQRTQEIGIRMALGAARSRVIWMVLRESLKLVSIGLAIGLPLSLVLTRLMTKWLFGVEPLDAVTYLSVLLMLIAVALISCYLPARRAADVDPMTALRFE